MIYVFGIIALVLVVVSWALGENAKDVLSYSSETRSMLWFGAVVSFVASIGMMVLAAEHWMGAFAVVFVWAWLPKERMA